MQITMNLQGLPITNYPLPHPPAQTVFYVATTDSRKSCFFSVLIFCQMDDYLAALWESAVDICSVCRPTLCGPIAC